MSLPTILLSILIASLYGALFHVFAGGTRTRLLVYIVLSCAGFFAGHFIGAWMRWIVLRVGAVDLGMGTAGSVILLGLGYGTIYISERIAEYEKRQP